MNTSRRKPHNQLPGYTSERTSRNPTHPGHFIVLDREKSPAFALAPSRWVVVWAHGVTLEMVAACTSQIHARDRMNAWASGENP